MNKEIFNEYIEYLSMSGFFENSFIDEYKFRNRLYKYIKANNIVIDYIFTQEFKPVIEQIAKTIIEENIEATVKSLEKLGIVETVVGEDGVEKFKLKQ
jgi:hypothetical protein